MNGNSRQANRFGLLFLALSASLLLTCCASPRRSEPVAGPLPIGSAQLTRGERAFMAYCNKCHPGGESGLAFALNNKPLPGPLIKSQVRAGMGAMPAFSKELLPEEDLDAIVEYLKVLRKH